MNYGTVYRIQSRQDRTRGAYHGHVFGKHKSHIVSRMCTIHSDNEHPCPYFDIGINRGAERGECCGFNSAADLLRWFRGFIPDLLGAGYEIVALRNIMITAVGEYQVLFKWND